MKNLGSKFIETERLEIRHQTMKEQKYLWELLMIPEVNKYFLTKEMHLNSQKGMMR